MEIIWKKTPKENSPILLNRQAGGDNFRVKQMRVIAGGIPDHIYTDHGINLTTKGNIIAHKHTSNGKKRVDLGNTETMCVMPVGQTVYAEWDCEYENLMIDFTHKYLSQMALEMNVSGSIELCEIASKKDELIQYLGLAFLAEGEKKENSSNLYSESLSHTLMFHIVKNYSNAVIRTKQFIGGLSNHKLRRVTEFINDNLDQDLTLMKISEIADLSYFHFARAFRKSLGITPQQYITNRRVEKAKDLLANSTLPIAEISFQTGFKNQSHFTTLFRKFTSFSPKGWRKLNQA